MFATIPHEIVYWEILPYLTFADLYLLLPTSNSVVQNAFRKYILKNSSKYAFYYQLDDCNNLDLFKIFFEMKSQIGRMQINQDAKIDPKYLSEYDDVLYNLISTFSVNGMRYYFLNHQGPIKNYTNFEYDPDIAWQMSIHECYLLEDYLAEDLELLRYIVDSQPEFIQENLDTILNNAWDEDCSCLVSGLEIIIPKLGLLSPNRVLFIGDNPKYHEIIARFMLIDG